MSADAQLSPLFQRFNGVMLGLFSRYSALTAVREQWPALHGQMSRLGTEINLDLEIPTEPEQYERRRDEVEGAVLRLGGNLREFKLAFGLGYRFCDLLPGVGGTPRWTLEAWMSALKVSPALLDGWLERLSRDDQGRPSFDGLMTAGLKLSAALVAGCTLESDACFVAMPFRDPYPTYYHEVYRTLLETHGLRCVRAWGGMRNEEHHDMLLALIDRCGWVFADLTDANPNVAYELGFAMGRDKHTLAVMDMNPAAWTSWRVPGRPKKMSNLKGIPVAPYDSSASDWRDDFLQDMGGRYVKAAKEIYGNSGHGGPAAQSPQGRVSFWSRLFGR